MASYQVLARKYRPKLFSEVVGQKSVIQTLKNALKMERVASAYLFSGSRGVGKTTIARLFAKSLNCKERQDDLEPCGKCPSCIEISSGQSLDVIEIDGASNRGIDDIRQINETVAFAPSHGLYKIYLIDEVHMLTKEAFNALLKTLEEPPLHVKFFFATTEPHKILPTILSRCQRFDLGRLNADLIAPKLASICEEIKREIEPEAIELLSRFADGSLRDAESLLDQLLCFSNEKITAANVRDALGLVPQEILFKLDLAFKEERLGFAFEAVDTLFHAGKDLAHFLQQLIEHYRLIVLAKTTNSSLPNFYKEASENYTQHQAIAILDHLVKVEAQFSKSFSQKSALEIALLQLIRLKNRIPIEVLVRRLSELEEHLKNGSPPVEIKKDVIQHIPIQPEPKPLDAVLETKVAEEPSLELKPAPFSPSIQANEQAPLTPAKKEENSSSPQKHPSHYDTLIRFAAVELEGTIKNN